MADRSAGPRPSRGMRVLVIIDITPSVSMILLDAFTEEGTWSVFVRGTASLRR